MLITLIISFEKHGNNVEHCTLKSKLSFNDTCYCFATLFFFFCFFRCLQTVPAQTAIHEYSVVNPPLVPTPLL